MSPIGVALVMVRIIAVQEQLPNTWTELNASKSITPSTHLNAINRAISPAKSKRFMQLLFINCDYHKFLLALCSDSVPFCRNKAIKMIDLIDERKWRKKLFEPNFTATFYLNWYYIFFTVYQEWQIGKSRRHFAFSPFSTGIKCSIWSLFMRLKWKKPSNLRTFHNRRNKENELTMIFTV